MPDNKEYISKIEAEGSINISEDVLSIIAFEAIKDVDGVGGIGGSVGKDMGKKSAFRSVKVSVADDAVTVDAVILITYGRSVNEVARAVQSSVTKAVGDMTGLSVAAVNVHVSGIVFDKGSK